MPDDSNIVDKIGGLIGSVLKPVIGEKRVPLLLEAAGAGLVGGATHGDPNAVTNYWNAVRQVQQRKQLQQLWNTLHPDQPMPPDLTDPAQILQPERKFTAKGYYETPFHGTPTFHPMDVPGKKVYDPNRGAIIDESTGAVTVPSNLPPRTERPVFPPYPGAQPYQAGKPGAPVTPTGLVPPDKASAQSVGSDAKNTYIWPDGRPVDKNMPRYQARAMGALQLGNNEYAAMKKLEQVKRSAEEMKSLLPSLPLRKASGSAVGNAVAGVLQEKAIDWQSSGKELQRYKELLSKTQLGGLKNYFNRVTNLDITRYAGIQVNTRQDKDTQASQLDALIRTTDEDIARLKAQGGGATTPTEAPPNPAILDPADSLLNDLMQNVPGGGAP